MSRSPAWRPRWAAARWLLVAALVAGAHGQEALAQADAPRRRSAPRQKPSKPESPAPQAAPSPPVEPVVLPDPPTPVVQAREVGLAACAPVLDTMARATLRSRYDVQSAWSSADPSRHVFQSVAALTDPANTPPDGLAALVAAPVSAGGCDGVALQVFPLAGNCQAAQKTLLQDGKILAPMLNTRIMLDAKGHRIVLLPGFNDTCIAVSVDSYFGTP